MLQCAGVRLVLPIIISVWSSTRRHVLVIPKPGDIQITGPDTAFQGDEVLLQCVAGPSHPGEDNFISNTCLSLTSLETIITWTVADNMKVTNNTHQLYLPDSDDLRKITRSSLKVKVKDIWQSSKLWFRLPRWKVVARMVQLFALEITTTMMELTAP